MTLLPCVSYESKGRDFCGPLYLYGRLPKGNQYSGSTGSQKRWSPPSSKSLIAGKERWKIKQKKKKKKRRGGKKKKKKKKHG